MTAAQKTQRLVDETHLAITLAAEWFNGARLSQLPEDQYRQVKAEAKARLEADAKAARKKGGRQ